MSHERMPRCHRCNGEMDIHYGLWCPTCDKPADINYRILDFFRVAKYISAHEGYDWTDTNPNNWYRTVLGIIDFPCNDCYMSWYVQDTEIEVLQQFNDGLVKYFYVEPDSCVLLNISW